LSRRIGRAISQKTASYQEIDMAEQQAADTTKRDRSPAFPYVGLAKALERIETLFRKVKRYDARLADIAADWDLAPKSSSLDRLVAALLSYGLVESTGAGEARKIKVSEIGWRILEDKRAGVREKLLAEAALRPPIMLEYANRWKGGRPDDSHALSQLKFEGKFTDDGAKMFLRVFDETIRFTEGVDPDKAPEKELDLGREPEVPGGGAAARNLDLKHPAPKPREVTTMEGERELTTGLLSKDASFRLIVKGEIGPMEIDRLIKKLEFDRDILADSKPNQDPNNEENDPRE
jgi:hypothetical protein